jgi:soluble lytic murein transglycosylase-like protein
MTMLPIRPRQCWRSLFALTSLLSGWALGHAADRPAEHVTLTNGFDLICDHHEQNGNRMRLYTEPASSNFIEVPASQVVSFEAVTVPVPATSAPAAPEDKPPATHADLTKAELHELLSAAGASHNLDVNLLASVVRAESGGHTQAISKAGAKGLMQLMPKTAADLGVNDSFRPDENIAAGTAYLDKLLTRYHDNLALALAAYNAGPAAVDRWRGIPPYRETRLYVARIIRDFNASVRAARLAQQAQRAVAKADAPQSAPQGAQIR